MRNIICSIKKEKKAWWKRLLKSEEKPAPYIKVDWNKWCDEDEQSDICKYASTVKVCLALTSKSFFHDKCQNE